MQNLKKAMSIPDGEYELRTNMADYRLDTDEFITMQWATELSFGHTDNY